MKCMMKFQSIFPSPCGVSFILILNFIFKVDVIYNGFRLLAEYHSFLFTDYEIQLTQILKEFPSPCGVSFILIKTCKILSDKKIELCFRLLAEYHSFLFIL